MTAANIAKLKDLVQTNPNFQETNDFFFMHFADEAEFTANCNPCDSKEIQLAMQELASSLFKKKIGIADFMPLRYTEGGLIHGMCVFENRSLATFFYFEDIKMGISALQESFMATKVIMSRITAIDMPKHSFWMQQNDNNMN